jgi:hypothetical protein
VYICRDFATSGNILKDVGPPYKEGVAGSNPASPIKEKLRFAGKMWGHKRISVTMSS